MFPRFVVVVVAVDVRFPFPKYAPAGRSAGKCNPGQIFSREQSPANPVSGVRRESWRRKSSAERLHQSNRSASSGSKSVAPASYRRTADQCVSKSDCAVARSVNQSSAGIESENRVIGVEIIQYLCQEQQQEVVGETGTKEEENFHIRRKC